MTRWGGIREAVIPLLNDSASQKSLFNVCLCFSYRNLVQAIGTLCYMFLQSWKLSTVAFISVPIVVVVSKYYGEYIRKLSKRSQEALAKASSVAEEALSSMSTVRSFACEEEEGPYRAQIVKLLPRYIDSRS